MGAPDREAGCSIGSPPTGPCACLFVELSTIWRLLPIPTREVEMESYLRHAGFEHKRRKAH